MEPTQPHEESSSSSSSNPSASSDITIRQNTNKHLQATTGYINLMGHPLPDLNEPYVSSPMSTHNNHVPVRAASQYHPVAGSSHPPPYTSPRISGGPLRAAHRELARPRPYTYSPYRARTVSFVASPSYSGSSMFRGGSSTGQIHDTHHFGRPRGTYWATPRPMAVSNFRATSKSYVSPDPRSILPLCPPYHQVAGPFQSGSKARTSSPIGQGEKLNFPFLRDSLLQVHNIDQSQRRLQCMYCRGDIVGSSCFMSCCGPIHWFCFVTLSPEHGYYCPHGQIVHVDKLFIE